MGYRVLRALRSLSEVLASAVRLKYLGAAPHVLGIVCERPETGATFDLMRIVPYSDESSPHRLARILLDAPGPED